MLISSSSPSVPADESASLEGEWWLERLGRRSGVCGGREEVRLRTGENDLDASRLLCPKPGVPLVARLSGSVSGRETTRSCVNTGVSIRDIGRRTLGLVLFL